MRRFYLGCHEPSWLKRSDVAVPLFVSLRRLVRIRKWYRSVTPWALDSGGFTELTKYGEWTMDARTYVQHAQRCSDEIGSLDWIAPQDWMCEPLMLARTGLDVVEHQRRTVANYVELHALAPHLPFVPVLQGQTLDDYMRCVQMYEHAGVDLAAHVTVGLGSVCRRQHTQEIGDIVTALHERDMRLHGFGCKSGALRRYGALLTSADSMAWSFGGRKRGTCTQYRSRCGECLHWALDWRSDVLASLEDC